MFAQAFAVQAAEDMRVYRLRQRGIEPKKLQTPRKPGPKKKDKPRTAPKPLPLYLSCKYTIDGMSHIVPNVQKKFFAEDVIAGVVQDVTGCTFLDIIGKLRNRKIVTARHVFCYLTKKYRSGLSYPDIGCLINRDHTTVLYAVQKCDAGAYDKIVYECEKRLGAR